MKFIETLNKQDINNLWNEVYFQAYKDLHLNISQNFYYNDLISAIDFIFSSRILSDKIKSIIYSDLSEEQQKLVIERGFKIDKARN